MKKKDLAIFLLMLAIIAALYVPRGYPDQRLDIAINETETCIPDPEYFIDCISYNETRINTTLLIHNRTIIIENASYDDHLEIWEEVLTDFPPHATENIAKIVFNANMSSDDALMESGYEKQDKLCGMNWTHYGYCVNNRIRVKENATSNISRTFYKQAIAHDTGHSVRLNYSDMFLFLYIHSFNGTADNFITRYAMTSNLSNEEDFAESVRFWRGNTPLFLKISKRNKIMQTKFEIVSRQICYGIEKNATVCPIYVSKNANTDLPNNYNGTIDNHKGLFNNDLRRKDIKISKPIANLSIKDFDSLTKDLINNGT